MHSSFSLTHQTLQRYSLLLSSLLLLELLLELLLGLLFHLLFLFLFWISLDVKTWLPSSAQTTTFHAFIAFSKAMAPAFHRISTVYSVHFTSRFHMFSTFFYSRDSTLRGSDTLRIGPGRDQHLQPQLTQGDVMKNEVKWHPNDANKKKQDIPKEKD